ncbi:hypothetical protein EJ08DRAFT_9341 [Tothia fuscella]|uniref:Uncharacterized protein n=1 Tax=Tothia fuscella TaxID=1048955 RepID=A0A9P4P521_9PEZI|nr:hypothetical protein EJ08DRAFT_9341 [Tothia fuscella]
MLLQFKQEYLLVVERLLASQEGLYPGYREETGCNGTIYIFIYYTISLDVLLLFIPDSISTTFHSLLCFFFNFSFILSFQPLPVYSLSWHSTLHLPCAPKPQIVGTSKVLFRKVRYIAALLELSLSFFAVKLFVST